MCDSQRTVEHRRRGGRVLLLLLLNCAVSICSMAAEDKPLPSDGTVRSRPKQLQFKVIHRVGDQPVVGARISVSGFGGTREIATDEQGLASFEYPEGDQPASLSATISQPGLVKYYVNFGRNLVPSALPTEKAIRMDRGKKVGGKVVDPEGKPVAGALMSITIPATDTPSDIHYHLLYDRTAEDGTWQLDGAPVNLNNLLVNIEHPRFVKAVFSVQDRTDGTYMLDPGLTLTGRVLDQNGKPVPQAHITVGHDRWGRLDRPVPVAEDGTYIVYALKQESTWITAEAPGFSPQIRSVEVHAETKPIDFQMTPGHTIRFKIVDVEGEPIAGIRICADTWNGKRTLWWQATTDNQGLAKWDGAPDAPVEFDLVGTGYASLRNQKVTPRDDPHVLQILRPLKVEGTVTDLQKGKVAEFRVTPGFRFPGNKEISWNNNRATTGRNGKFEIEHGETCDEIFVRVEALGYRPWTSEAIPFAKSHHKVFVRMESATGPAGIVWSPEGQPVAGAQVTLITARPGMQFQQGYRPLGGKQTVTSNEKGRFEMNAVDEEALIVAVHETGYAELPAAKLTEAGGIHLQKWARVEAVVKRGAEPLAGAKLQVNLEFDQRQGPRITSHGLTGITDANGRVTFDRVVPRNAHIVQTIERQSGNLTSIYPERSANVTLTPGAAVTVELGGTGSAVVGRFAMQGEPPMEHRWSQNDAVVISSISRSPTGRGTFGRSSYRALVETDGSFRIHDVPAGPYQLSIRLTGVADPQQPHRTEDIGNITQEIEVVAGSPVVELGVIEGTWFKRLSVGHPLPHFVASAIHEKADPGAGNPGSNLGLNAVRSSHFQGRLLLIDFWSSSSNASMRDASRVVALYEEFSPDPRFQLLGLSVDNTSEDAGAAIQKGGWAWPMGFAGPGVYSQIPQRFQVQGTPERFLIDVNGTVLYRGRDLEQISRLIRKRLSELPPGPATPTTSAPGLIPTKVDDPFPAGGKVALVTLAGSLARPEGASSPRTPALVFYSEEGTEIRRIEGMSTSDPQQLFADASRERFFHCDSKRQRLLGFNRHGQQLLEVAIPDLHAATVDEHTGDIWCLTLTPSQSGELLILDPTGREKVRYPSKFDGIDYSPVDDAFWLVGPTIMKIDRDATIVARLPPQDRVLALVDVAADRKQGGAWVVEHDYQGRTGSRRQLWKVLADGSATTTYPFPENRLPRHLACIHGQPWLTVISNFTRARPRPTTEYELLRFSKEGLEPTTIPLAASVISIGQQTGAIWLRTPDGLVRIDAEGRPQKTIPLPSTTTTVELLAF